MKALLGIAAGAFGVTIALIIGQRMTTDAMAVVIGVATGIAASVPVSLLLVAMLRRERQTWRHDRPAGAPAQQPPAAPQLPPNVLVIDPMEMMRQYQNQLPLPPMGKRPADGGAHRLRVIGQDED